MKSFRQFALVLAVLLPLFAPTMACALPHAHLSPAEQACCTQMAGQCGSMNMPATHGCCQKEVPAANHWNPAVQTHFADLDIAGATAELPSMTLPVAVTMAHHAPSPGSTLPQSPPRAISVLRI